MRRYGCSKVRKTDVLKERVIDPNNNLGNSNNSTPMSVFLEKYILN